MAELFPFAEPLSLSCGDNFILERQLHSLGKALVAGTDEAGRGPLAGPVVAAAVILPESCRPGEFLDSKKLTHHRRLALYDRLSEIDADIGIGICSAAEIDEINILQASLLAMKRAVSHLTNTPDFLLVDGKFTTALEIPQLALTKGEDKSASIAAASIVAKVTRDNIMQTLHQQYPQYNFCQHKGYPTEQHRKAIAKYGICKEHRRSFKGVREYVEK